MKYIILKIDIIKSSILLSNSSLPKQFGSDVLYRQKIYPIQFNTDSYSIAQKCQYCKYELNMSYETLWKDLTTDSDCDRSSQISLQRFTSLMTGLVV